MLPSSFSQFVHCFLMFVFLCHAKAFLCRQISIFFLITSGFWVAVGKTFLTPRLWRNSPNFPSVFAGFRFYIQIPNPFGVYSCGWLYGMALSIFSNGYSVITTPFFKRPSLPQWFEMSPLSYVQLPHILESVSRCEFCPLLDLLVLSPLPLCFNCRRVTAWCLKPFILREL